MDRNAFVTVTGLIWLCLFVGGCGRGESTYTPTPTKTPSSVPTQTVQPVTPQPTKAAPIVAQKAQPSVDTTLTNPATLSAQPEPTVTPLLPILTAPPAAPPTVPPVSVVPATPIPATPIPAELPTPSPDTSPEQVPAAPVQPPLRAGSWDMEDGFYVWPNPYDAHGGFVAEGWSPFIRAYQPDADPPNPPRLNENKEPQNIQSGQRSQEVSFDYRTGEIGIFRQTPVTPGHRYLVEAWAKVASSPTSVQIDLGIDLAGGTDFAAPTVTWYPWRDSRTDHWLATQETIQATGDQMTLYLRATHEVPAIGGNTMFDNASITDLGP